MNTHFVSTVRAVLATAVLASTAALPAAHAQMGSSFTGVSVPFAFEYNSHQLPAGHYRIRRVNGAALEVWGDTVSTYMMSIPGTEPDRTGHSRLVFHRYGSRYFLCNFIDRNGNNISMTTSKGEKDARQSEERLIAQSKSLAKPINVEVAAEAASR